ncbi:MAG: hypothetical protein HY064_11975 [Bacteroidetes bacterium]|nr:hypothetical protein [Bacteroidota bacterium]
MKKYKVNIDRQKPSSDEILSKRNFDGLMKQYNASPLKPGKKPFWKKGWFAGSAVTAVIAVSMTVVLLEKNQPEKNNSPAATNSSLQSANTRTPGQMTNTSNTIVPQKRKIAPPLKGMNISFTDFKISSAKGGTVTYNSGSKLIFPENAFVDANGKSVNGNVDIHYREFHDPVDVFLAGIPMQYDSAGKTFQFESAGMMEVTASMNGTPVYLDKNKNVQIQFASENSDSKFSVYLFDTTAGNWIFKGKNNVQQPVSASQLTPKQKAQKEKDDQAKLSALQTQRDDGIAESYRMNAVPAQPRVPIHADKTKHRFPIDCDPREFPEILAYKDVIWTVDESKENFDTKAYDIQWEDFKISKGTEEGKYILTLKKGTTVLKLDVYPSYEGTGLENATKEYDKLYQQYSDALAKRDKAEQTARSNYEIAVNNGGLAYLVSSHVNDAVNVEVTDNFMRVFTISNFGIYNCDCAGDYPGNTRVVLAMKDADGKAMNDLTSLYLVDRHHFGLYSYGGNPVANFTFDSNSSNMLWGVKNGMLYTADDDQFKNVRGQASATFVMKPVLRSFASPDEMKNFFGIHTKRQ